MNRTFVAADVRRLKLLGLREIRASLRRLLRFRGSMREDLLGRNLPMSPETFVLSLGSGVSTRECSLRGNLSLSQPLVPVAVFVLVLVLDELDWFRWTRARPTSQRAADWNAHRRFEESRNPEAVEAAATEGAGESQK